MKSLTRLLCVASLIAPVAAFGQGCETLRTISTDGTGSPDTYRTGGTYVPVPIEQIQPSQTLRIVPTSGPYRYVTLHSRTSGGSWNTAYQGDRTEFPGTDPVISECRQSSNCTHIIVAVNGAHERYESVVSAAEVQLCASMAQHDQGLILDSTWTARKSGWQIDLPSQWGREVQDDPNGGTGMFFSEDGMIAVGVSTLTPDMSLDPGDVAAALEQAIFEGATPVQSSSVSLAGLSGELRRYQWNADGLEMMAIASYLPAGQRFYAVWAVMPTELAAQREPHATQVFNTFRLLAPPMAPETHADAGLSVALLSVGADARISETPGFAKTMFHPDTPEIHIFAAFAGTKRTGHILQQLHYLENGQVALEQALDVSGVPQDQLLELRGSFLAPANGWPRGAYRVVLMFEGQELASRMIYVGEAQ